MAKKKKPSKVKDKTPTKTKAKHKSKTKAKIKPQAKPKPKEGAKNKKKKKGLTKKQKEAKELKKLQKANPDIAMGLSKPSEWLRLVIAGTYGVGKSVLAGQCADVEEMNYVFYGNVEDGTISLKKSKAVKNYKNIIEYKMHTVYALKKAHAFMLKHCLLRDKYLADKTKYNKKQLAKLNNSFGILGHIMFNTFIIDSVTRLEQRIRKDINANDAADYRSKWKTADKRDSKLIETTYKAVEMTHFGVNTSLFESIIDKLCLLPIHLIILAGERPEYETFSKEEKEAQGTKQKQPEIIGKLPKLSGQVPAILGHHAGVITFLVKKEVNYRGKIKIRRVLLLNDETDFYKCKSRITSEDVKEIVQPTMKQIFQYHLDT